MKDLFYDCHTALQPECQPEFDEVKELDDGTFSYDAMFINILKRHGGPMR